MAIVTIKAGREIASNLDTQINEERGIKDQVESISTDLYTETTGIKDLVEKHEAEIYTAQTGILARLTALENPN